MPDLEDGLKLHGSVATATQLEQLAIIKQNFAEVLNEVPGKIESEEILLILVIHHLFTLYHIGCVQHGGQK